MLNFRDKRYSARLQQLRRSGTPQKDAHTHEGNSLTRGTAAPRWQIPSRAAARRLPQAGCAKQSCQNAGANKQGAIFGEFQIPESAVNVVRKTSRVLRKILKISESSSNSHL